MAPWDGVRLHVVTGKGGTGKTTVAAALALALAAGGRRTLVVEVEGRQGLARLFDTEPLPYEERRVAVAPDGGDVYALAVDTEAALLEYLEMFYKLGRAGRMLKRIGAVDFATTVAPGLRDVLLTGKVYEAVGRRRSGPPGVRRRRPRRPADRADHPVPQRQHRGRRPGQVRADPHPVRRDHGPAHLRPHGRARGHAARGDAGPGDRGRPRRARRGRPAARRRDRQHGAPSRPSSR